MTRITSDEWMAELRRLETRNPDGMSAAEIAEAMGCSLKLGIQRIGRLIAAGRMEYAGGRAGFRIDGRGKVTPVYRLRGGDAMACKPKSKPRTKPKSK